MRLLPFVCKLIFIFPTWQIGSRTICFGNCGFYFLQFLVNIGWVVNKINVCLVVDRLTGLKAREGTGTVQKGKTQRTQINNRGRRREGEILLFVFEFTKQQATISSFSYAVGNATRGWEGEVHGTSGPKYVQADYVIADRALLKVLFRLG